MREAADEPGNLGAAAKLVRIPDAGRKAGVESGHRHGAGGTECDAGSSAAGGNVQRRSDPDLAGVDILTKPGGKMPRAGQENAGETGERNMPQGMQAHGAMSALGNRIVYQKTILFLFLPRKEGEHENQI